MTIEKWLNLPDFYRVEIFLKYAGYGVKFSFDPYFDDLDQIDQDLRKCMIILGNATLILDRDGLPEEVSRFKNERIEATHYENDKSY